MQRRVENIEDRECVNREEIGKNQEGIYSGESVVTLLNLVGVRESVVTLVQRGSPYSPCSQLKAYTMNTLGNISVRIIMTEFTLCELRL